MVAARLSIAVVALALVASCARGGDSPSAEACARVVQQLRGVPDRVEVFGTPLETSEGQVEIAYEYVDAENLPVSGSATCTFAVGGPGSLELVEAIVDEEPLDSAEVRAANRVLSKR